MKDAASAIDQIKHRVRELICRTRLRHVIQMVAELKVPPVWLDPYFGVAEVPSLPSRSVKTGAQSWVIRW
ncbi:MAG: hypothetical protein ACREWI_03900 [Telluria sp.]